MHIETVRNVQSFDHARMITDRYITLVDPKTNKKSLAIETHVITLYDQKGRTRDYNNKHGVDQYA